MFIQKQISCKNAEPGLFFHGGGHAICSLTAPLARQSHYSLAGRAFFSPAASLASPLRSPQHPAQLPRSRRRVRAATVPEAHVGQEAIPSLAREADHARQRPRLRRCPRAMEAAGTVGDLAGAAGVGPARRHDPPAVGAREQHCRAVRASRVRAWASNTIS